MEKYMHNCKKKIKEKGKGKISLLIFFQNSGATLG